jgi:hypothetical protein
MKHGRVLVADLVEQAGEHINAAARRAHRRRARRVSGPWDRPTNAGEYQLTPQPGAALADSVEGDRDG